MSNPFSASEISSPSNSVRSFGADRNSYHVPSTTSKAKPKAITASARSERDGADTTSRTIADSPDHQNGHPSALGSNDVLDDHEGSDPNTPRLPPTNIGITDLEQIPSEAAVPLDLPDHPSKSLISSPLEFRKHPYRAAASSLSEPVTQTPNEPRGSEQENQASLYSQDKSHIRSWLERSQQTYAIPPTNETTTLPYIPHTKSNAIASSSQMSGTWGQEAGQTSIGSGHEHPTAMSAREEAFSEEKRNRSSSRSSQSRVEKRIEATMADAEPPSHARSRKSSHVLGLFKENKSSHDNKRAQERQRTTSDNSIDAFPSGTSMRADEAFRPAHGSRPALSETHSRDEVSGIIQESLSTRFPQEQPNGPPNTQSQLHRQLSRTSSTGKSSADGSRKSRSDTDLNVDDSRPEVVKVEEKADGAPEHKIPPRLLEEIRDYHNLTTPFHDKFRSTQPKSTGMNPTSRDKQAAGRHQESRIAREDEFDNANLPILTGELENEEEESEHISSALYYPHQAPSPDALEDISIDDARKRKDARLETQPDLPDPALPVVCENEKVEDVDIALQVHNKNRYLHGDLQKARPSSSEPDADGNSESGLSSASDSEYESLDETKKTTLHEDSSLTDDAEATPRASPKTRQSYLLSRSRKAHRGPKARLGAVELKPYNHQVGGHTTVFRFSKRAVCKQLTNRENEFYEVIERQHPDLLSFLPRYVPHKFRPIRASSNPETLSIQGLFLRNSH